MRVMARERTDELRELYRDDPDLWRLVSCLNRQLWKEVDIIGELFGWDAGQSAEVATRARDAGCGVDYDVLRNEALWRTLGLPWHKHVVEELWDELENQA